MRKIPLMTRNIYHICNRGVNKYDIFFHEDDYRRFLLTAIHYKTRKDKFSYTFSYKKSKTDDPGSLEELVIEPKIQVLAYCFIPNHFHFLLKQLEDGGISWYMQHLTNSYSHYINIKYERVGSLLQGRFRNVPVESNEQLLHVSRYIHLNPLIANLTNDLKDYRWSSYLSYISDSEDNLLDSKEIQNFYKTKQDYQKFVLDQEDYARELERIKHFVL